MSYSSGRIYCQHGVDPKIGVSIRDVQRALSTTMHYLHELCTHKNINKWAKFKPVKFAKIEEISYANRVTANFGFADIPVWSSKLINNVARFVFSSSKGSLTPTSSYWPNCDLNRTPTPALAEEYWRYQPPTGGASSPFRITDFVSTEDPENKGYFIHARPPFQELAEDDGNNHGSVLDAGPDGKFTFLFPPNLEGVTAGLTVRYEDIDMGQTLNLGNMYFGIVLRKAGASSFYAYTQNFTAGNVDPTEPIGTLIQGYSLHMALEPDSGGIYKSATNLLGTALSGDVELFPLLSSIPLRGTAVESDYAYPKDDLGQSSGTFVVLNMMPQTVHLSIIKAKGILSGLNASEGLSSGKKTINVNFGIIGSKTDIDIGVTVTVKVYSTPVISDNPEGTKVVNYTLTGSSVQLKSITLAQGDELPQSYTVTSSWIAYVKVEVTDSRHVFKETVEDSVSIGTGQAA